MTNPTLDRRNFMKRAGLIGLGSGLGSSFFTLALPKGSWAESASENRFSRSMPSMGTLVNIDVFGEKEAKAREAVRDAFAEIRLIHDLMSTHQRTSNLNEVNRVAGNDMAKVDPRITEVVKSAIEWGHRSDGVFDVTILPLLKVWGFREDADDIPDNVSAAESCVGFRQISIVDNKIGLKRKGAGIDVCGLAKGYAVDRAIGILRDKWEIKNAIVNAGGDLYCLGHPEDAPGFRIGVHNPLGSGICATLELCNQAIGTTGNYNTRMERDGKKYTDIFNPFTGQPVETYLSVSVVAPTTMAADASSVTLFSAGKEKKIDLSKYGCSSLKIGRDESNGLRFTTESHFPTVTRV